MSESQIIRNGESYDLDTREHMDNGVSVQMCPNDMGAHSNVSQNLSDTREKLEADVRQAAEKMEEFTHGEKFINTNKILRWLDRQAAITERELCAKCDWPSLAAMPDLEQQERIAELTAERDQLSRDLTAEHALVAQFEHDNEQLREAIDAMENGQFYAMYRKACEERDHFKDLVHESAERICVPHGEWERLSQTQEFRRMYCDCGYELGMDTHETFPYEHTIYCPMLYFCPQCGARIVSKANSVKDE